MDILKTIEEMDNVIHKLKKTCESYMYDSGYQHLIDSQLNGLTKGLICYCKTNNLGEIADALLQYGRIECNAIEFSTFIESIREEIISYKQYCEGSKRGNLISQIAYQLQDSMTRHDIDSYLGGYGVQCLDEHYQYNSKRIYVQNTLANIDSIIIKSIAKDLELLQDYRKDPKVDLVSNDFIQEQIEKFNVKINNGDYDGAITNARSMLEEILLSIEERILEERQVNKGNLPSLFRRVRKLINMEPNKEIDNELNKVLNGLYSAVEGLSSLRNKMSDGHARSYRPSRHHAIFVVNCVSLISEFVVDSYNYQNGGNNSRDAVS